MLPARPVRRALLLSILAAGIVQPASAQTYPSQNINFVVAFAAGRHCRRGRAAWWGKGSASG